MRTVNYLIIGILLLITSSLSVAQDTVRARVELLGRAQPDHILLRWAPNTPLIWKYSNKYGMKLERYTILRDGKVLDVPEKKTFPEVFKPAPLEKWEAMSETNDYALVAAQAIYGESFEVTESFSSEIAQAINQTKELEQRHYFAMFAADQSKEVAMASGLFYEDRDVKKNEKYIYTIICQVPKEIMRADTGQVYIGIQDYFKLPAPEGLKVEGDDKMVLISWEGKRFEEFYNSFIVERSDDNGKSFKSITDLPIVNPLKENGETADFILKGDSIQEYDKKYIYRVKGINPFGELSPASDTASIVCRPKLQYVPHILATKELKDGSMQIQWYFPKEGIDKINGFKLRRAEKVKGEVKEVKSDLLPTDTITIDTDPSNSNYYTIVAYDKYGNETNSLPSLAMLEDSIPPLPPVNIKGEIDTLGLVKLQWDNNKEKDLHGYRIYRSNFATKEFSQISVNAVADPFYTDTIEVKTLTKKVYYKIVAVDKHFNPSDFSDMLELERPDIIPPVSPQFQNITTDDKGIHLEWNISSSVDVEKYVLYRKASQETGWSPIFSTPSSDSIISYTDSNTIPGETYGYTIIAVDLKGLESMPARPVSRKRLASSNVEEIKHIIGKADRKNNKLILTWKYEVSNVNKYLIYRAAEKENLELYKEVDASEQQFLDTDLKMNTIYKYRIQVKFNNGALSPFSKEIVINY